MPELVTIIMPLYNGEHFIDAAVESVREQTYPHWELLIVDDGSSDSSLEKAQAWEQKEGRIKALRHPGGANKGVSASRNLAIACSSGTYLALLDCDDVWLPGKLERQLEMFKAYPQAGLLYSKAKTIDEKGTPILKDTEQYGKRPPVFGAGTKYNVPFNAFEAHFVAMEFWVPTSSAIFKKALTKDCLFVENLPYQFEDLLFFLTLAKDHEFVFCEDVLIKYRVHTNQWNSRKSKEVGVKSSMLVHLLLMPLLAKDQRALASYRLFQSFKNLCAFYASKATNGVSFKDNVRPFLADILNIEGILIWVKFKSRIIYLILYGYAKITKT